MGGTFASGTSKRETVRRDGRAGSSRKSDGALFTFGQQSQRLEKCGRQLGI